MEICFMEDSCCKKTSIVVVQCIRSITQFVILQLGIADCIRSIPSAETFVPSRSRRLSVERRQSEMAPSSPRSVSPKSSDSKNGSCAIASTPRDPTRVFASPMCLSLEYPASTIAPSSVIGVSFSSISVSLGSSLRNRRLDSLNESAWRVSFSTSGNFAAPARNLPSILDAVTESRSSPGKSGSRSRSSSVRSVSAIRSCLTSPMRANTSMCSRRMVGPPKFTIQAVSP